MKLTTNTVENKGFLVCHFSLDNIHESLIAAPGSVVECIRWYTSYTFWVTPYTLSSYSVYSLGYTHCRLAYTLCFFNDSTSVQHQCFLFISSSGAVSPYHKHTRRRFFCKFIVRSQKKRFKKYLYT